MDDLNPSKKKDTMLIDGDTMQEGSISDEDDKR
jgi:hypothetical protein